MRESILIVLLASIISSLLLLKIQALESPEFTREQEFRTRNGTLVLQSGSNRNGMFIVSLSNRTIDIKPTSSALEPCKGIPLDPFEDKIVGEVRATILRESYSNVRKIVIWGVHRSEIRDDNRIISYAMLLIDVEKCQSKALWLPYDQIHSSQAILLPDVQTAHDKTMFDVYFASQQHCAPCRFDLNGNKESRTISQLEAETAPPADIFHLHPVSSVEDAPGYFYSFNFVNASAVVKLLNYYYQVRGLRYLDHRVDVVAVKTGRIRNVGYCYQAIEGNPKALYCERLDSRLQSVVSVRVPLDKPVRKVSLEYDDAGNYFVAAVFDTDIHVFAYTIFGELVAILDFGQLQHLDHVSELAAYIDADQYCLFYSIRNKDSSDANNIVKCINKTRYIE